jgi:DNA-directed RNA polymerase specialized sigma24 family protein
MTQQLSNQLYNEILALTPKFSFWYKLDRDDQTTVLTKVFMIIQPRIESGHIPNEPKDRKGYLVITIKNEIYKMMNHNNTKRRVYEKQLVDDSEFDMESPPLYDTYTELKTIIKELTPFNRAVFRWNKRGWSQSYIGYATNRSEAAVNQRIQNIRKQLLQLI